MTLPTLEETIKKEGGEEIILKDKSELAEVFDNLDDDSVNEENMSSIDFNTRLSSWEASACNIFDEMKAFGILDKNFNISRMKKRLNISINGLGRREKVDIASANQKANLSARGGGILGGLFGKKEDKINNG